MTRRIALTASSPLAHIEAPGCIINILTGLSDLNGQEVTSIEILVDGDRYAGDPEWWHDGVPGKGVGNIRVVRLSKAPVP